MIYSTGIAVFTRAAQLHATAVKHYFIGGSELDYCSPARAVMFIHMQKHQDLYSYTNKSLFFKNAANSGNEILSDNNRFTPSS